MANYDYRHCIIGNLKYEIVSTSPTKDGYLKIIAKPAMELVDTTNNYRRKSIKKTAPAPEPVQISEKLLDAIQEFIEEKKKQYPNFKVVRNATAEAAAIPVSKLIKDGYDEDVVIACIRLAVDDPFWKRNLMTLTQMNKVCSDGLTKFEHVLTIYEEKKDRAKSSPIEEGGISYEEL